MLALAGCAAAPAPVDPRASSAAYQERAERLGRWPGWALDARVAIRDGDDGGSGRIEWRHQQQPPRTEMSFRGALGRGAWDLDAGPEGGTLRTSDGRIARDASLDALVLREAGWPVPIDALAWWVRGIAAPDPVTVDMGLDALGQPRWLEQGGWRIEYDDYRALGAATVPGRIEARSGERSIKLVVTDWNRG